MNYKIEDGIEHYRDISRKEHPEWIGWQIIDHYKKTYGCFQECQDKCGDLEEMYNKYKIKNYE